MPKKPLLLPSAKAGVLVPGSFAVSPWWRFVAIAVGVLVVVVGAADALTRVSGRFLGFDAARFAFAPVALLGEKPSVLSTLFASSTEALTPVRLQVPEIGVDATVEQVTQKTSGAMATPTNFADVGWYKLGSKPGAAGSAVFAGHVSNASLLPGVFAHLSDIAIGDKILVSDTFGKTLTYLVSNIDQYPVEDAPLASIFSTSGPTKIVLITCDGAWNEKTHTYDKRLVIQGRLLP